MRVLSPRLWCRRKKTSEERKKETYLGFEGSKFDLSELALKPLIRNKDADKTRHVRLGWRKTTNTRNNTEPTHENQTFISQ